MMRIEKKCVPSYFKDIVSGKKRFELRLADWECKEGDILVLKEYDLEKKEYTGRTIEKKVTYILKTKDLNLFKEKDVEKYGYQILSIE